MATCIDLTNQKFGKLTVVKKGNGRTTSGGHYKATWICKCECGNVVEIDGEKLRRGHTSSCGCLIKENKGSQFEDLTGQRFNRLTVIKFIPYGEKTVRGYNWLCKCDCGKTVKANASKLKNGLQQSCGCLKEEMKYNIGNVNKKYKFTCKRLYGVYKMMVARCTDPNIREYENYGGRGVTVCDEWLGELGYDAFAEWAFANGYDKDAKRGECTLDRKDVNKGYEPDNCRWISNKKQQSNKRTCRQYTYNGETLGIAEWAERLGVSRSKMYHDLVIKGYKIEEFFKN